MKGMRQTVDVAEKVQSDLCHDLLPHGCDQVSLCKSHRTTQQGDAENGRCHSAQQGITIAEDRYQPAGHRIGILLRDQNAIKDDLDWPRAHDLGQCHADHCEKAKCQLAAMILQVRPHSAEQAAQGANLDCAVPAHAMASSRVAIFTTWAAFSVQS